MAIPKLTDIFKKEADRAFTKEISAEIWRETGKELGFSDEEIQKALPAAIQGAEPEKPAPAGRRISLRVIVGTGVAAASVAAALIIGLPALRHTGPTVSISGEPVSIPEGSIPLSSFPLPQLESVSKLHYTAGAEVSFDEFLKDAQVRARNVDGTEGEFRVLGFEDIDFETPGEYFVQIEMGSHDQKVATVVVVTIE